MKIKLNSEVSTNVSKYSIRKSKLIILRKLVSWEEGVDKPGEVNNLGLLITHNNAKITLILKYK